MFVFHVCYERMCSSGMGWNKASQTQTDSIHGIHQVCIPKTESPLMTSTLVITFWCHSGSQAIRKKGFIPRSCKPWDFSASLQDFFYPQKHAESVILFTVVPCVVVFVYLAQGGQKLCIGFGLLCLGLCGAYTRKPGFWELYTQTPNSVSYASVTSMFPSVLLGGAHHGGGRFGNCTEVLLASRFVLHKKADIYIYICKCIFLFTV